MSGDEFNLPQKTRDLPASHGMVFDLRNEMVSRFDGVDHQFEAVSKKFDQVDKKFDQVDKRFDEIDKRFDEVDKRFDQVIALMNAGFARLEAKIDHGLMLAEAQHAENRMVLEGYNNLKERQDRLEVRQDGFDGTLHSLIRSRGKPS